ncbi:hypothetical protein OSTOST_04565 [Ostertagia ostertagi]
MVQATMGTTMNNHMETATRKDSTRADMATTVATSTEDGEVMQKERNTDHTYGSEYDDGYGKGHHGGEHHEGGHEYHDGDHGHGHHGHGHDHDHFGHGFHGLHHGHGLHDFDHDFHHHGDHHGHGHY